VSTIPISGLTSSIFSGMINICQPGNPNAPELASPTLFQVLFKSTNYSFTFLQDQSDVDSCTPFVEQGLAHVKNETFFIIFIILFLKKLNCFLSFFLSFL